MDQNGSKSITDSDGGCDLGQKGDPCTSDADCRSNKCCGPSGGQTCK